MPAHTVALLRVAASVLALPASAMVLVGWMAGKAPHDARFPDAEMVPIAAGVLSFRSAGEFLLDNRPATAPIEKVTVEGDFGIMKYQVTRADYDRCVKAAACDPLDPSPPADANLPATGTSYLDAEAYARWYSRVTGESWRLPTDAEWALAAAERFTGDVLSVADDPDNPAIAWIRRYQEEAARKRAPDPEARPRGHYGANSKGVFDVSGNVWEWTSTCYVRSTLLGDGKTVGHAVENCGVHVIEGRHRAYMSNFIREGKSGGCSVGTPPDNLGFRLVRDKRAMGPFRLWARMLGVS
jgi:formylglycine-generating enzyme required for sulfatase activity